MRLRSAVRCMLRNTEYENKSGSQNGWLDMPGGKPLTVGLLPVTEALVAGFVSGTGVSGCDTGKQSCTPAGGIKSRGDREHTSGIHRFEATDVSGNV